MNLKNLFNNIFFKPVFTCNKIELKKLLEIRNEINVRKNMFNSEIIDYKEHLKWKDCLKKSSNNFYYAILKKNIVIGGLGFKFFNDKNSFDWSFHLSSNTITPGMGAVLEYKSIEFIFSEYKPEILNCYVKKKNLLVSKLHKKFGFEQINIDKNFHTHYSYKNTSDIIKLFLTKKNWQSKKKRIEKKLFSND